MSRSTGWSSCFATFNSLLLMAQRKDVMLESGQCLALKGSVALPLVKVGGYGLENTSSKYVPSYLLVKKESVEQT